MDDTRTLTASFPHENACNAIRFFFCLIVIIMHSLSLSHSFPSVVGFFDGHLAVCGFFILSGFWVTKSYLSDEHLLSFCVKRVRRLLPMYYVTVFGFAVLLVFFSEFSPRDYFTDSGFYQYLFWNAIFLNFMHPALPGVFSGGAVNGSLWTIKVEIGFYIILPILVMILKRLGSRRRQNLFLLALYVLSVLWNMVLVKYAARLHVPQQLSYQLPGFLSFFVCGMAYIFNWNELKRLESRLILPALLLVALHYVTKTEILFPVALTIVIFFVGTRFSFLARIGKPKDYSYCMYLFHFPLVQLFASLGFFARASIFCMLIIIAATLGMAFVAEKYIQERFLRKN